MDPSAASPDFLGEVYLAYGLSCLLMAVAIYLLPRERAVARFAPDTWLLGLFALSHGAKELTEWWMLAHRAAPLALGPLVSVVGLVSFVPLLEFGRRLVLGAGALPAEGRRRRLGPGVYLLAATGILAVATAAEEPLLGLGAGTRYFLAFPGALLTAWGLLLFSGEGTEVRPAPGLPAVIAASGFFGFAVFEGLFVPADLRLMGLLPTDASFLSLLGLPVQLFRALSVAVAAVAVMELGRRLVLAAHDRAERALREANTGLERRVAERTGELEAIRTRLEIEIAERCEHERVLAQSETRLRASEAGLRRAQRVANVGSWHLDLRRDELTWSEQTYRIFGIPDGAPLGYGDFLAAVHPEDREAVDRAWRAALAGAPYEIEHRIVAEGRVKWVREQAELEIDAPGNLSGGVGTVQDVSERRAVEQSIREAEARYRTLVEQIPAITYVAALDEKSSTTYVSPQLESILGYAPHAWLEDPGLWASLLHPEDRERVLAEVAASQAAGVPFRSEYRMLRPDGAVVWFRDDAELVRDEAAGALCLQGVMLDITDRKRAEQALRDSEERLRLALVAARQGLYDLNVETGEAKVTPEYASMLGYDPAAFRETNAAWIERLHPDDRAAVAQTYRDYVEGRLPEYRVEFRQRMADGRWKWVLSLGRVVERAADGRPLRMLGTHTDISALKEAEAALRASEEKYRLLFEANPQPMWVYDLETLAFLAVNDAAVLRYGWTRAEFLAMSLADLRPPEDRRALRVNAAQVTDGLDRARVWRHRLKDRSVIEVEIAAHVIDFAGRRGELVLALDVTERRRAERQVREQERLFNLVANTSPSLIWMSGTDRLCTYFNEPWLSYTGRSLEQELGNGWTEGVHPEDLGRCLETYSMAFNARQSFSMEYRLRRRDGQYRWILDEGRPRYGASDRFEGYIGACLDIHERKQTEAEVARARSLLRTVVDSTPDWIFAKDSRHRFIMVNRAFASSQNLTPDDMIGRPDTDFWPSDLCGGDPARGIRGFHADDDEAISGHTVHNPTDLATLANGTERAFDTLKLPLREATGQTYGVLAYARDMTERRRTEEALQRAVSDLQIAEQRQRDLLLLAQREQGRMAALLSAMSIGILFEDGSARVEYANPAFKRMWAIADAIDPVGQPTREVLERSTHRFARQDHASKYVLRVTDTHEVSDRFEIELADGRILTQISFPVEDPDGRHLGRLWIYEDITHERQTAQQLIYLAERDPLTGLHNRHRFQERLEHMISSVRRGGGKFALLYFDLDEFKHVNDSFGHRAGDTVLVRVGGEIGTHVRATELFARLGGDEFAVLSHAGGSQDMAALAARIVSAVSSIPFRFRGSNIRMTCSVGVAIYPDHGETAEDLVAHADAAMYQAKYQGKNGWALYDPRREASEAMVQRLTWNRRIGEALERDLLQLHFQGVYRSGDRQLTHLEALVRILDPSAPGRLVMPGQFIAFAEKSGQILDIDRWVVRQAVELLARSPRIPPIAINVSGRSFDDPGLPGYIRGRLADRGVDAGRLIVELTETAAVSDIQDAQRFIEGIRQAGCRVCLDDFGSGFSSFAYLKYLDADILKIDGLFIRDLPSNRDNQVFVKAMVDVARGLHKATVAEFVEDAATLRMVAELGVDMAQGYHLDRPAAEHPSLAV